MDLDLTAEKLDSMRKTGLTAVGTLIAAPGKYRLRTVVREGMKGRIAAASGPVEVRGN